MQLAIIGSDWLQQVKPCLILAGLASCSLYRVPRGMILTHFLKSNTSASKIHYNLVSCKTKSISQTAGALWSRLDPNKHNDVIMTATVMDKASVRKCRQLCSDLEVSSQFQILTQDIHIRTSLSIRRDRGVLPFHNEPAYVALDCFAEAREYEKHSDKERRAVMNGTFEMLKPFRELYEPMWHLEQEIIWFSVSRSLFMLEIDIDGT